MRLSRGRTKMSPFNYTTSNMLEVLVWNIDEHGFVQVELVPLET